ncbi:hypothetical protein [Teredinibacter waterburyi]|uniref:hypothetical protein n=1 Tax=Teredinibacter waterburyi TaxID=1500538 RepID=UPI00165F796C|nr:hypothetical protein [Teredinibacter waterburyi]
MLRTQKWLSAIAFSLTISTALTGCNTTPIKTPATDAVIQASDQQIGISAYEMWRETANPLYLEIAKLKLSKALTETPDNVFVQKAHYLSHYMSFIYTNDFDLQLLTKLYAEMNPVIKADTPPPSRITYAKALINNADNKTLIELTLNTIAEQPESAFSWHSLSEHYEQEKYDWLALAAAQQANRLSADNPEYLYQLGDSINDIIQQNNCVYEEREYAKRAVSYIAKAAAKAPNQLYYDNASLQYLNLGLFPLAYDQSKKAWDLERNAWTAWHYGYSSLYAGRYNEAIGPAKFLIDTNNGKGAYHLLAIAHVGLNQREQALDALENLEKRSKKSSTASPEFQPTVFDKISILWLNALLNGSDRATALANLKLDSIAGKDDWHTAIMQKFTHGSETANSTLIAQAKNDCEQTEAYFFDAFYAWTQGDNNQTKTLLKKTTNSSATRYYEYMYAWVLQRTNLLESNN